MKPKFHSRRLFPKALVLCFGSVFAAATASADLINFNENAAGNSWTFRPGVNLLAGASASPTTAPTSYGNSTSWTTLTDGILADTTGGTVNNATVVTPGDSSTVTFTLDPTNHPNGYTIGALDSYAVWNDGGRDDQQYSVYYATASAPGTFIKIADVNNHTDNASGLRSTHTALTDTTGILAQNVVAIQIVFGQAVGQENGWVGYSEFRIVEGQTPLSTNYSNTTGLWTFPAGANLLNGSSVTSPSNPNSDHGNGVLTSSSWATLTDGQLGANTNRLVCVSPSDGTTVTFPLDTLVNAKGYNLTSFDSYSAWADAGRDDQQFTIRYATWDNPTVFIPLASVANHTATNPTLATHTTVAAPSGYLATGVVAIQVYFNNQENGYVGYREFIALGSAAPLNPPLTWTGGSGSGGNATWITGADNNWTPGNYSNLSPLNFTQTGNNRNITLSAPVNAASLVIANDSASEYVFSGSALTVANDITSTGSGSAKFNNAVITSTGIGLTGSGSLTFGGGITSPGLNLAGTGKIKLSTANPGLTGTVSVSNGTLTVGDSAALASDPLVITGGIVNFTTVDPQIVSLSGTGGQVVLGDPSGPVNTTLLVGDPVSSTVFSGNISEAVGTVGGILKQDQSSLTVSGDNTYTGQTYVLEGSLELGQRLSLYHGNTALWTSDNITVGEDAKLTFNVDGANGFTDTDLGVLDLGGFEEDAILGIDNGGDFTFTRTVSAPIGFFKDGLGNLTLTGASSFSSIRANVGNTILASASGPLTTGDVFLGYDGHAESFIRLGAPNQFSPNTILHLVNKGVNQSKLQLNGFSQTLEGLDSPLDSRISVIQNDDSTTPGYVANPGPATLTLTGAGNHSFYGLIRNQDGGPVSLVKNGPGTQEFINNPIQGYGYTGDTTVNGGTLKLTFNGGSFASNVVLNGSSHLELAGSIHYFTTSVSGTGQVLKTGPNLVIMCNGNSSYSGGTYINGGVLVLDSTPTGITSGAGNAANQTCILGLMDPSNVVTIDNASLLAFDKTTSLGQSTMVPAHGVSIVVKNSSHLMGNQAAVVFVPNVTLDGGFIDVGVGDITDGFNTNLCLVGTVIVGGSSSTPSAINAPTTAGPNNNISLGSAAAPGTTFQVADVTGDATPDLAVSAILRDIGSTASPLVKTGPGTMLISGANTYTGNTTVTAGTLAVTGTSIADSNKLILNGGKLDIAASANETVGTLYYGATQQVAGTYGSSSSSATFKDDTRFSGTGILTVTFGPGSDPYAVWSAQISDPAQRGRTADPDHDGFTNQQEYLFGTSPTASTGSLAQIVNNGSGLVIQWNQLATGTSTYVLKESTTLASGSWTTSTLTITNNPTQDVSGYTRKQAVAPLSGPRKFYRVEATE